MLNKIHFYAIYLVFLALPLCALGNSFSMPPTIVKDIAVVKGDFFEKHLVIGKCLVEKSREYKANVQGRVDAVLAQQDSMIKEGEMIISIDRDLAIAAKNEAIASYESAYSNNQRDISLFKRKIISEEALYQSNVALEKAKNALNKSEKAYEDMIITAPFDGYVGVVKAKVGDEIKIGAYLFSIFSAGEKYFFVDLPEVLLGKINSDSIVYANDLDGNEIKGQVLAVSNYVSEQGTLNAKLTFPESSKLAYGSFVEITIIYNKHQGLALPEQAVLKNNDGNFVYKIVDGKAKQEYIKLGTRTGAMVEVVSDNINIGDAVIIEGLTKVFDGSDIVVSEEKKEE
jgi:RND family efflux transporter MFP subunit